MLQHYPLADHRQQERLEARELAQVPEAVQERVLVVVQEPELAPVSQ